MYLILSTPSLPYADSISRELWLLVRPRCVDDNETSQLWVGSKAHPDKTKVYIGPIEGAMPIHKDADEFSLAAKIGAAITEEEATFITEQIASAKGGSLDVLELIEQIDSLSPKL